MRYLFITLTILYSAVSFAQQNTDSISVAQAPKEVEIKMSMSDFEKLNKEKDNAIAKHRNLLDKYNELLKQDSINTKKLLKLNTDYPILEAKYKDLLSAQEKADKCLLNTASNFLYIPYEAYGVQEIAIPAFEAVSNQELKNKHEIKLYLLKSYQTDIKSLLEFIFTAEKELSNPFAKNAKDLLIRFQSAQFYVNYKKYNDWNNTYLGLKIISVEKQLKTFDGNTHKLNLEAIKNELNSCLKTIENL